MDNLKLTPPPYAKWERWSSIWLSKSLFWTGLQNRTNGDFGDDGGDFVDDFFLFSSIFVNCLIEKKCTQSLSCCLKEQQDESELAI